MFYLMYILVWFSLCLSYLRFIEFLGLPDSHIINFKKFYYFVFKYLFLPKPSSFSCTLFKQHHVNWRLFSSVHITICLPSRNSFPKVFFCLFCLLLEFTSCSFCILSISVLSFLTSFHTSFCTSFWCTHFPWNPLKHLEVLV